MRENTRNMIKLALEGDPEATTAERTAVLAALDGRNENGDPCHGDQLDRVLTRRQVAERFGKSTKWVDWESKREGTLLKRVYLGGTRSAGFSMLSVKAALEAATSAQAQVLAADSAKSARAKAMATIASKKGEVAA